MNVIFLRLNIDRSVLRFNYYFVNPFFSFFEPFFAHRFFVYLDGAVIFAMKGPPMKNSFDSKTTISIGSRSYSLYSLPLLEKSLKTPLSRLPVSLRILLENLLRREDGRIVRKEEIEALARWNPYAAPETEIAFMPARVLLQDFTGVPCIVDLALMRDAMIALGGDPEKINPLQPVDLVIDHSVQVDEFGTPDAFRNNAIFEFERNKERYSFLRWGQQAFKNFRVVPPDTGIVHQVNLEYLAQGVISTVQNGETLALSGHTCRNRFPYDND